MMSWPCRLSSAASALSRRQLPQYILAAPAVNASIFILWLANRTNCSKTRHVGLNLFILERMVRKEWHKAPALCIRAQLGRPSCARIWSLAISRGLRRMGGACFSLPSERSSPSPSYARMDKPEAYPTKHLLLLALLLPLAATAQSVRGTVTDDGRKALEGVAVHLVHQETNRPRQALTDTRGEFTISNLTPGEY